MKNFRFYLFPALLVFYAAACGGATAQQDSTQKESGTHTKHAAGVNERGDKAMGFSHTEATHHFLLKSDGGSIEVEANDPEDTATRDKIRMHLSHIAVMFSEGNFNAPMLIHGQTPPGVPVMQRLKSEMKYEFEKTERGGRVRIKTENKEALEALHEFLRFQIKEHETGDPL